MQINPIEIKAGRIWLWNHT